MGVDSGKDNADILNNQVNKERFSVHIMEFSIIWSYRGIDLFLWGLFHCCSIEVFLQWGISM